MLVTLNHELLVRPKQGAAVVSDDHGAGNAGAAMQD
jgi:hypothetical protein